MVERGQHFTISVGYGVQVFYVDDVLLTGLNERIEICKDIYGAGGAFDRSFFPVQQSLASTVIVNPGY